MFRSHRIVWVDGLMLIGLISGLLRSLSTTVGGALIRISNCLEVVSILSHSPVKYHNLDSTNSLTPI